MKLAGLNGPSGTLPSRTTWTIPFPHSLQTCLSQYIAGICSLLRNGLAQSAWIHCRNLPLDPPASLGATALKFDGWRAAMSLYPCIVPQLANSHQPLHWWVRIQEHWGVELDSGLHNWPRSVNDWWVGFSFWTNFDLFNRQANTSRVPSVN